MNYNNLGTGMELVAEISRVVLEEPQIMFPEKTG